ncbi:MAG: 50S ribosomal protein L9 [Proteobacteria bacterium]|nr:50S ribosomal protein L9 [Pseudomonadota bacterium]MBU4297220.1 50S ribosomal protein L9 [Pseudomonadota bacterium]MCG2748528.1 50S ribosomal protein L9 [Desulfobulbaceae bacterium]
MELILKKTIDTLGEEGDLVKVKPGYGRNYLIPRGKAVLATKTNLAILEQEMNTIASRKEKDRHAAEELSKKIAGVTVVIEQRVGEEDKLYGSVTSTDIADKLASLGVVIDKRKIVLDEPIKTLGITMVPCKTGYQMTTEIKVEIVPLVSAE